MNNIQEVYDGWEFMNQVFTADISAKKGNWVFENIKQLEIDTEVKNNQIEQINNAIDQLKESINNHTYRSQNYQQFKGYVAEEWHSGTFNINAIKVNSENRAWTLGSNDLGSVDIDTTWGEQISSKYCKTANDSIKAQAMYLRDIEHPKYDGQARLIPTEQLSEAKIIANKEINCNLITRPEISDSYKQTGDNLTDRIIDPDGIESNTLTVKDAETIAKEGSNQEFDPEKHGIHKEGPIDLGNTKEIEYISNGLKAGLTAASISMIIRLAPELYKAIDYLIKNGEIDIDVLKNSGKAVISAGAEGFLRGSAAYLVELSICNGLFGEAIKKVTPPVIGSLVVILFESVKCSIAVAQGKMTPSQMGEKFIDTVIISSIYTLSSTICQMLLPQLPIISYLLGGLLGSALTIAYEVGKKKLISLCIDTGFTCFGLVDQDYKIPDKILNQMGISTADIPRTKVPFAKVSHIPIETQTVDTPYETVDITILERGLIGINKVGYILK